jgi:proteasome lid subunit RPN8/RPN11
MNTNQHTIDRIRAHASRTYPEECCGFLVGAWDESGDVRVIDAEPVENVREEMRERRYRIAPDDVARAELAAEEKGLAVVGFYHSHPDHPARPSDTDLAEATFPGYVYVIASVEKGRPTDVRSWSLRDDRSGFDEQPVQVEENQLLNSN